ncbi:conserved hypothetical protein, membrane [Candidatus Magnetomorum sp. HK-1]|nr:conserved hypothetical protein, membrane [Candidatus Magnetomorum sp. HK-1]
MKKIIIPIIVIIIEVFAFPLFASSNFIEDFQDKANQLADIVKKFYQNKAQQSLNANISHFIQTLSPYTLEGILVKNLIKDKYHISFESDLTSSIGQQFIFISEYDLFEKNIIKNSSLNDTIKDWVLEDGRHVLAIQKELFSHSNESKERQYIGTIYLLFSAADIESLVFDFQQSKQNKQSNVTDYEFILSEKMMDFIILFSIPILTLLTLYFIFREIKKKGPISIRDLSPRTNIVILLIILFFILFFKIFTPLIDNNNIDHDQHWYAEKLLEKTIELKKYGKYKLAKDYFNDIQRQYLSETKHAELDNLNMKLK